VKVSIVNHSQIDKKVFRLEAEFYTSAIFTSGEYFTGDQIIESSEYNSIYGLNDKGIGYPVLRMNEFDSLFTGKPKLHSDKFSTDDFLSYALKKGDILICRTNGNPKLVGKSALAARDYPYVYESHLFKIRPIDNLINSATLVVFLNTEYGKMEIEKFSMQGNQANFSLAKFKEMRIPKLAEKFNNSIEELVFSSFNHLKSSEDNYSQAQNILLSELGLTNWQPKHQLTFVKNYSDTKEAERIDAEYFQPKYEEIEKAIKSYSGGWNTLGNLVNIKDKNINPADEIEYKYIELSNIASNGEVTDCMIEQGLSLPSRARRKVSTKDVIVSSIEGSLPSIALVQKEYNKALCSTGFYVINSKSFNSETLLVLLKSPVGQLQLKKGCNGTILTAINKDEFKKVVLPIIDDETQSQIQQKITESFKLRKLSKHLLECAKRAVEIAIEQDEDTAVKWLKHKTEKIQT